MRQTTWQRVTRKAQLDLETLLPQLGAGSTPLEAARMPVQRPALARAPCCTDDAEVLVMAIKFGGNLASPNRVSPARGA